MPNTTSAKKAMRQNEKRRVANRSERSSLRTILKKCRMAATSENAEERDRAFRTAVKSLDQAASKNLMHKNTAARTKSRLAALFAKAAPKAS